MARVCYLIFIFTSSVLALVNCQQDLPPPSCLSFVSNSSCSQIIYGMIDCISFLSAGAAATKPVASCCSGFKSVLKADADCICQAIKLASQMGIKLNMTRAVQLPSDCGVSHFSVSKICGFSDSAGTPPAKSPKPSPKTPVSPPTKAPIPSSLPPTPVLPPTKAPIPSPLPPTPVSPPTKAPTLSPLPPTKSVAPSPRTKTKTDPVTTLPATKIPVPSPKSPISSLPKSKSAAPSPPPIAEGGLSQALAPTLTNLKSGSYSLSAGFAVIVSVCVIYLSFISV